MKKIIYFLPAFIAVAILINIQVNLNQKVLPTITLQNIEALSNSEFPEVKCYGIGSIDCPSEDIKVKYIF
jgi:hypothetical protein